MCITLIQNKCFKVTKLEFFYVQTAFGFLLVNEHRHTIEAAGRRNTPTVVVTMTVIHPSPRGKW